MLCDMEAWYDPSILHLVLDGNIIGQKRCQLHCMTNGGDNDVGNQ